MTHDTRKSDRFILPAKPSNKADKAAAEMVEVLIEPNLQSKREMISNRAREHVERSNSCASTRQRCLRTGVGGIVYAGVAVCGAASPTVVMMKTQGAEKVQMNPLSHAVRDATCKSHSLRVLAFKIPTFQLHVRSEFEHAYPRHYAGTPN